MVFIEDKCFLAHMSTHCFFPYKSLEKVHGVSYGDAGGSSQGHPPPVPMHPRGGLIFSAQWLSSRKVVATFVVPLHHSLSLAIHTHFGAGHLVATTSMGSAPSGVRRPSPNTQGLWGGRTCWTDNGACFA